MYIIKPYTKSQAKLLNVIVKPSTRKNKKIDVYTKDNQYICSIGSLGYLDYPNYLEKYGDYIANYQRELYKKRHHKDRLIEGSKGWYADNLLW